MPLVSKPAAAACRAERLTGAGSGPDRPIAWPDCPPERESPAADPGEKVALPVLIEVGGEHVPDIPLVDISGGNKAICHEIAEPLRGMGVHLVVVHGIHVQATCAMA